MSKFTNKFVNRLFRRVGGVVWDPISGGTGLRTDQGIYTFKLVGDPAVPTVSVNPFDEFGMALPAFATQTPFADVAPGDIIVGDVGIIGWVVSKTAAAFKVMDHNGYEKTYAPPTVSIVGQQGVLVVRNLLNLTGGEQNAGNFAANLMPLLLLGGTDDKLEKLLPLLLMTSANGQASGQSMNNLLPLLLMKEGGLGGGSGSLKDMLPLLMLSGGMGGAGGLGGNPMLMMALLGDGDLFGGTTEAKARTVNGIPTLNPVSSAPTLQRL